MKAVVPWMVPRLTPPPEPQSNDVQTSVPAATVPQPEKRKRPAKATKVGSYFPISMRLLSALDKEDSVDRNDSDVAFCMSLVATFKKFDQKQKSLAQMKIQQLMYEIEFPPMQPSNIQMLGTLGTQTSFTPALQQSAVNSGLNSDQFAGYMPQGPCASQVFPNTSNSQQNF